MNASINQIKTKQVKVLALPDEVFGLIKQWVLPVKPNLCYNCNINCTENDIHLIKLLSVYTHKITRNYYCNECFCSYMSLSYWNDDVHYVNCHNYKTKIIKNYFKKVLELELYPINTDIKQEQTKRNNKISGEWRLVMSAKFLNKNHKIRKTQEKAILYERLLSEGIKKQMNFYFSVIHNESHEKRIARLARP